MRWVHRELCENIGTILLQFEDEGIPARFSMVGFRDYIADSTNWIEFMDFADEEEVDELANWLDRLKAKEAVGTTESHRLLVQYMASKNAVGRM